ESAGGERGRGRAQGGSRSGEAVSRDRLDTSRQFRRTKPRFSNFLERERSAEISRRLPCDPERSEAQWAGRCACHRAVSTTENLPCFRILQQRSQPCLACAFPSCACGLPKSSASRRRRTTRFGWSNALPGACRLGLKGTCP